MRQAKYSLPRTRISRHRIAGSVAATLALLGAVAVHAATIELNQVTHSSASAVVVPDESDIGSAESIWLGARYGEQVWLRNGNIWQPFDGSYPPAVSGLTLGPVNAITLGTGMDVSGMTGLELYVAYGQTLADTSKPGHLEKIYTVTTAGPAGQSAPVDVTRLPLGDGKVSTSGAQRGRVFACQLLAGGGASNAGPWIDLNSNTYDLSTKLSVQGKVYWTPGFSVSVNGESRIITGNGLPSHASGIYPINFNDPAYQYDTNPNSISTQSLYMVLPAHPQVNAAPACLNPGAIGVLKTGVVVFNALDAENRDAVAHEVQDRCQGHPERNGSYHYHNVSACIPEKAVATEHSPLAGYALDGFGIYGRYGENGQLLTNDDLDECHGHAHAIEWDGQTVNLYHYHATWEYPYTLGCFRGTPAR